MSKITLSVMLLTVVSKIFGFLRQMLVNTFFGAGPEANVFHAVFDFPTSLMALAVSSIIMAMIPVYSKIEKSSQRRAELYISNLFNIVFVIMFGVSLLVFLFPSTFVSIFYDFTSAYEVQLATTFMRIIAFGSLSLAISNIMTGYLNLMQSFIKPAVLSILMNVVVISGVFIAHKTDFIALPVASLIAFGVEALVAFYWGAQRGFRLRPILRFNIPSIKRTFRLSIPIAMQTWMNQIAIAFNRKIGTGISTGTMVYYSSATLIGSAVQGIFANSIMQVMYPTLSRQAANHNLPEVKKTLRDLLTIMAIFVVPITIGGIILSEPLMELLYHRGAFLMTDVISVSNVFTVLALGFYPLCIAELLTQVFYSLSDTTTPLKIEGLVLALRILVLIFLTQILGVIGMAITQVIASVLKVALLLITFRRKYGGIGFTLVMIDFIKIVVASVVMGGATLISYSLLIQNFSNSISVLLVLLISILIYLIMILFSKIDSVTLFINQLKQNMDR